MKGKFSACILGVLIAVVLPYLVFARPIFSSQPACLVRFGDVMAIEDEPYGKVEYRAACDFYLYQSWIGYDVPVDRLIYLKPGYPAVRVNDPVKSDYLQGLTPSWNRQLILVYNDELTKKIDAGSIYYNNTYHGWKWYGIVGPTYQFLPKPSQS